MKLSAAFANTSIRIRLALLVVLNSTLALICAGIALYGYESVLQRGAASSELSSQAGIIAESSTAALSFGDKRAAMQMLLALRGDPQVVEGVIYDENNRPFARYERGGSAIGSTAPRLRAAGVYFEGGAVLVFQPIKVADERLGTIFLKSRSEVAARLRRYVGIVFLILLFSQGLALLVSARVQRTITAPVIELSDVARQVSADKNYAVRGVRRTGGEIGILIDSFNNMLSQIEMRELALRESEERYALAARGANDGLWDWKLTTGEIYFSARWNQMLGYPDKDRWSDPAEWFERIHPSDRDRVAAEVAAHRAGATTEFNSEFRMKHRNGAYIWVLSRGIAVRDADSTAIRIAGSQTDITEGKVADPLTGLPNRLYFIDRLEWSLDAARGEGTAFAVLFLDLDRFKLINDSLGHAAGDELLTSVAGRLRSAVRAGWEGRPFVVARLGGDEFAILLNDVEDPPDVMAMAHRILEKVSPPVCLEGRQVFANVSIGIALSNSGKTPEDILRNADTAMYHAKTSGGARYAVFDDAMRERAVARLEIETGLRKGIENGELVVYYQPELSLKDRRVVGYEALVRWNHPERGMLAPAEFIPIAEESDLIIHLGRWVLRAACTQMALWHSAFSFDRRPAISVNISPRHLRDPGLAEDVAKVLGETGLEPACLNLEMTESSIMKNPEQALTVLRQLKSMGVGLEIDDFGTGYSSLSLLHCLPFDTVKVDRSFVNGLGAGGEGVEIVRTIVDLARSVQMEIVAEGVETESQVQQLTRLGCEYVQGFYFSKPVGTATVQAIMQEREDLRRAFLLLGKADGETAGASSGVEVCPDAEPADGVTDVALVPLGPMR